MWNWRSLKWFPPMPIVGISGRQYCLTMMLHSFSQMVVFTQPIPALCGVKSGLVPVHQGCAWHRDRGSQPCGTLLFWHSWWTDGHGNCLDPLAIYSIQYRRQTEVSDKVEGWPMLCIADWDNNVQRRLCQGTLWPFCGHPSSLYNQNPGVIPSFKEFMDLWHHAKGTLVDLSRI